MSVGVLDWNLDIQQAISLPNFGSRNGPTELERGQFNPFMAETLKTRGHDVREIDMASGLQGIVRVRLPNGSPGSAGGADPRRKGSRWAIRLPTFPTSGQEKQWQSRSATSYPRRAMGVR